MNYLAHCYISQNANASIVGGMLGDFIKGRDLSLYSPDVQRGIVLHRAVDRYTDNHPYVKECVTLISRYRRRFAGILIDLFFDHFLSVHWQHYSTQPLEQFTKNVYHCLQSYGGDYPCRFKHILPSMCRHDWLSGYRTLAGIDRAIHGIQHRLRKYPRARVLDNAIEELDKNFHNLQHRFQKFFPQLIDFAQNYSRTNTDQ